MGYDANGVEMERRRMVEFMEGTINDMLLGRLFRFDSTFTFDYAYAHVPPFNFVTCGSTFNSFTSTGSSPFPRDLFSRRHDRLSLSCRSHSDATYRSISSVATSKVYRTFRRVEYDFT